MKRMGRKGSLLALGLGAAFLVSAIPAVAAPLNTEGSWKLEAGRRTVVLCKAGRKQVPGLGLHRRKLVLLKGGRNCILRLAEE